MDLKRKLMYGLVFLFNVLTFWIVNWRKPYICGCAIGIQGKKQQQILMILSERSSITGNVYYQGVLLLRRDVIEGTMILAAQKVNKKIVFLVWV